MDENDKAAILAELDLLSEPSSDEESACTERMLEE